MTFLPIVYRELREASRRKSTFRIRCWTALIAIVASFVLIPITSGSRGSGGGANPLFQILTGYVFGLCLLAGVFLTADSLSEEKREGTLGLLFLTDLKGYDVVLGKFFARGLNAFYGLLALLPVIALPLLLGGVTGGEYWRMALALINALFISLAAGTCVSAFSRDSQRAMGNTLGLLLLLIAGLPALAYAYQQFAFPSVWSRAFWISPFYPFSFSSEAFYTANRGQYWGSLLASHVLGWAFLAWSSKMLPRIWQESASSEKEGWSLRRWGSRQRKDPARAAKLRETLLPQNPVLWWMSRDDHAQRLAWLIVIAWGGLVLLGTWHLPNQGGWVFSGSKACAFLLKMLVAVEACRFFVEGRRNGALELMLCTPLRRDEIFRGQSLALRRAFLLPLLIFLLLTLLPFELRIIPPLIKRDFGEAGRLAMEASMGLAMTGWLTLVLVADILAVVWFGRWLSLTTKRPNLAP
ncbi:MAG TPA: ABC transporter permease, partial [Clostridia bacterium]|nr:ABC transporter permease [Clostridia bacterium]